MAYNGCPIYGGGMTYSGFFNWIIIALIFSLIFWGCYYLMIKPNVIKKDKIAKTGNRGKKK